MPSPSRTLATAAIALSLMAAPAVAHADVYWTTAWTIGHASSDGADANPKFIKKRSFLPIAVAVNGNRLYWASAGNGKRGSIGRSRLNGTRANPLYAPGIKSPRGLSVSDKYIYWSSTNGRIGRVKDTRKGLAKGPDPKFISGLPKNAGSLAVDDQFIYWIGGDGNIGRANLDGSGIDADFVAAGANPTGLAVDARHIYWTKSTSGSTSIVRANLDGSTATDLVTGIRSTIIAGLAVDSQSVYWTVPGWWSGEKSVMGRADLDGTNVNQSFLSAAQMVPSTPYGFQTMTPGLVVTE